MKTLPVRKICQNQEFPLISVAAASIGWILFIQFFGVEVINESTLFTRQQNAPSLQGNHKNLKIELVTEGLSSPTSMAFVDDNKILVLEKNTGLVRLISDGVLQKLPVLKLPVDTKGERGLLGIAVLDNNKNSHNDSYYQFEKTLADYHNYANTNFKKMLNASSTAPSAVNASVFLYFTESNNSTNNEQLRNRIYKYEWNGQTLRNPTLILDLPASPDPYHNGGKLIIGPDHYIYTVIGDLGGPKTQAQNDNTGPPADGTGGILRITQDGKSVSDPPLGKKYPLKLYYAYGIRNSFGIDFDPVNGNLWDTKNGEDKYDEINVVKPGFNSGWVKIMGPLSRNLNDVIKGGLVNFPGSYYSDPVFSWYHSIGITDIEFLKSSKLGEKYKNNLFVGDINNGNLYYFEVSESRTGLKLDYNNDSKGLKDMVADNKNEQSEIILGSGFKGITDIQTGPDGYLYILTYLDGKLYRIVPS
ncbi:MAG: PQQ-dependent sugar dehydrogenase [Candidatus Nitrosopolaris sp.]